MTDKLAALPDALATRLLESFASKPELLPQSPDNVTWDTPGVGSIDIEEFHKRIVAALREAMQAVRKRDAECMREAAEDVAEWGAYAGEYFQKKWDLAGCIRKWEERAAAIEGEPI